MKNFISSNMSPIWGGVFMILFGIFTLILAVTNPDWFFSENKTFNLEKVQGWINFFGRNTTRIIIGLMSVFLIVFGIFWIWAYSSK